MSENAGHRRRVSRQDARELVGWRLRRLIAAGFSRPDAVALAHNSEIDLHALLELIDRGCPPELAARITAPL